VSIPTEDQADLQLGDSAVVRPWLMIKTLEHSACWDYCEYVNGEWRQAGLKPNPDAPLTEEYFANPVEEDAEFDICGDEVAERERHRIVFRNCIS
jgi:hypothetical protein